MLVVGAPGYTHSGSVYFYRVSGTTDSPPLLLTKMVGGSAGDNFGRAVAVDRDGLVLVAGHLDIDNSAGGKLYLYA